MQTRPVPSAQRPVRGVGLAKGFVVKTRRLLVCLLCVCVFPASAGEMSAVESAVHESSVADELAMAKKDTTALLRQSGVAAQLDAVLPEVLIRLDEMRRSDASCHRMPAADERIQAQLESVLQGRTLDQQVADKLLHSLSPVVLQQALQWYGSANGRLISSIESESGSSDIGAGEAGGFEGLMTRYLGSAQWTDERQVLMFALLEKTLTAEFVTSYNTGVVSLATIASTCVATTQSAEPESDATAGSGSLATELARNERLVATYDWNDSFVHMVLRGDLLPVTGTIFRNVDQAVLQAYLDFASSSAGEEFFAAVVAVSQQVLQARVALIGEFFAERLDTAQSLAD